LYHRNRKYVNDLTKKFLIFPSANDQFNQCGSSGRPVSLVINGTLSERGAWPWLVTLHRFDTSNLFCGGTLISSNAVVTVSYQVSY